MSVKIRLARAGSKKAPYYHVIAADARSPRDGKFIEDLGLYDPSKSPARFEIKEDRVAHWVKSGAQLTETVGQLIRRLKAASAKA